jgi:hypothetical protein
MSYGLIQNRDHHSHDDRFDDYDEPTTGFQPLSFESGAPFAQELFLDTSNNQQNSSSQSTGFSQLVNSITSRSTKTTASYDMVEEDDYAEERRDSPGLSIRKRQGSNRVKDSKFVPLHVHIPQARRTAPATTAEDVKSNRSLSPRSSTRGPIVRTASGRNLALRHPTPDLQVLQVSYPGANHSPSWTPCAI